MKVSVCIPTRDRAGMVVEAIQSVLAQTFTDFEVLVMDDRSRDDATEKAVASLGDARVRYHMNPTNLGIAGNWNRGVSLATGEYVAILHDDDAWEPNFLERTIAALDANPSAGIAVTPVTLCDRAMRPLQPARVSARAGVLRGDDALAPFVPSNSVYCPGVIVRAKAYQGIQGFQGTIKHASDWDMWLRIALRHDVIVFDEILARYRTGHGSLTDQYALDPKGVLFMEVDCAKALESGLADARALGRHEAARRIERALAARTVTVGMWHARAGDRAAWAKAVASGIARAPSLAVREPRLLARGLLPHYKWSRKPAA